MTEKHKWISDNLSLIEETTGIKLYGTVCTDITFIAKQLNDANETILRLEKENKELKSLIKALKKSNNDYVNQIKKAYDEKLSIKELADNCGVDLK